MKRTNPFLRFPLLAAFAAVSFLLPAPAGACDLCAIYTGTMMQQEKVGPWLGVAEQYSDFGTIKMGNDDVANPHDEWMRSSITQLVAGWAFTSWAGVQAVVPLISREYHRLEEGVETRGDVGGLGDVSFLVNLTPYSGPVGGALAQVRIFGGLKTPTGDSGRLNEEADEDHHEEEEGPLPMDALPARPRHTDHPSAVHGHDLALGSGSWDGVVGTNLFASWKRAFLAIQLQYAIRSRGDYGYQYADDLTWMGGPGVWLVTDDRWTASFQFVLSGEHKGKDVQNGVKADDTAITALYLGPAVGVTWLDNLTASLAVDLPAIQDVSGMQIVPDYRLRGGLTWHF